jgi:hypothetical protein
MPQHERTSKFGRPTSDPSERLSEALTVRVTPSEFQSVTTKCRSLGLSQSSYLRTILLQGHTSVRARVSEVNLIVASEVHEMAESLARIAALNYPINIQQMNDLSDQIHLVMCNVVRNLRGAGA